MKTKVQLVEAEKNMLRAITLIIALFGSAQSALAQNIPGIPNLPNIPGVNLPNVNLPNVNLPNLPGLPGLPGGGGGGASTIIGGEDDGGLNQDRVTNLIDTEDGKKSDFITAFDGWSQMYTGYDRSPIIFDPSAEENTAFGRSRQYPELSFNDKPQYERNRSLKTLNLGVDDEIKKTSMVIYQPIRKLTTDMANDKISRDDHLNLFSTLRGVATLTLSYLDKTVAAGLATVQQQLDKSNDSVLLKQIAWTTSKLANPERAQLYRDTDEKVEECVLHKGTPTDSRIVLDCDASVCPKPTNDSGIVAYCVCCAEQTSKFDKATADSEEKGWSLTERVMYGTKRPQGEKKSYVETIVEYFKQIYGDYQIASPTQNPEHSGSGQPGSVVRALEFPQLSPAQAIWIIRNGPPGKNSEEVCGKTEGGGAGGLGNPSGIDVPSEGCHDDGTGMVICPITGQKITKGICPALVHIVRFGAPLTAAEKEDLKPYWVEASLGKILTGRDIENIRRLAGINHMGRLPDDFKIEGDIRRFIQSFSDASAVAAYKRLHARMKSIALDHMALSTVATAADKADLSRLMDRVSDYLALAEYDAEANYYAANHLTGGAIAGDRGRASDYAAGAVAAGAAQSNQSMGSSMTVFGGVPRTFDQSEGVQIDGGAGGIDPANLQ